jgi:hypothetical protein
MNSIFLKSKNNFCDALNIYDFAKLNINEKLVTLKNNGLLFDYYIEKDILVNLYFMHNFFIEERVLKGNHQLLDIIPFKRGFQLNTEFQITKFAKTIG